jgi:hypothetical protein
MSIELDPYQYYIVTGDAIYLRGYVIPGNVRDILQNSTEVDQQGYYNSGLLYYEDGDTFRTKDIVDSYTYMKAPIKDGRSLEIDQDNAYDHFKASNQYDIYYYIDPILQKDQVKPYDEKNGKEIEWDDYERMKKEKAEAAEAEKKAAAEEAETAGKKKVKILECNKDVPCPDGYDCNQKTNTCAKILEVPNKEAIKEAERAAAAAAAAAKAAEEAEEAERVKAAEEAEKAAEEEAERAAAEKKAAEEEKERLAAAEEEAERVKAAAEKAAESQKTQKTQKTRVSIFVSHNKKLNCLFKELLETNEETEIDPELNAELEALEEEEAEAEGGGFQDGGVFGDQERNPSKISINITPCNNVEARRSTKRFNGEYILVGNNVYTSKKNDNLKLKKLKKSNGKKGWFILENNKPIGKLLKINNPAEKIIENNRLYIKGGAVCIVSIEEYFSYEDLDQLSEEDIDKELGLKDLKEVQEGFQQENEEFQREQKDVLQLIQAELARKKAEEEKKAEALLKKTEKEERERKKQEEETKKQERKEKEKEAKTETHFINGAVIKIEITDDCKITLLNSTAEQIKDEIKRDKVEHTKHGHKVWCSDNNDNDNEVLYLEKIGDRHNIYTREEVRDRNKEPIDLNKECCGLGKVEPDLKITLRNFENSLIKDIEKKRYINTIIEEHKKLGIDKSILYFVRHGQGWHNLGNMKPINMIDSNLTIKGIADGMYAALSIYDDLKNDTSKKEFKFFTSDLHRSQQTNDIIYRFLKYKKEKINSLQNDDCLYQVPCLHEIDKSCKKKVLDKPSSTPFNPYNPIYWPNDKVKHYGFREKAKLKMLGGEANDIQYIKDIIYKKEQDEILFNKYISKICLYDEREKSAEYVDDVIKFFKEAICLLYYKPQFIDKRLYYPSINDEEGIEKKEMKDIEIYKQDKEMYDIMKTLTRLQYSDYEDEQKRRELFQHKNISALTGITGTASGVVGVAATTAAAPLATAAVSTALGTAYAYNKHKKKEKVKKSLEREIQATSEVPVSGGSGVELAALAAAKPVITSVAATAAAHPVITSAAAAVIAGLVKKADKNSYCNNFNLNEHLKYLMMIGITWEHWSEPFKDDDVEEEEDDFGHTEGLLAAINDQLEGEKFKSIKSIRSITSGKSGDTVLNITFNKDKKEIKHKILKIFPNTEEGMKEIKYHLEMLENENLSNFIPNLIHLSIGISWNEITEKFEEIFSSSLIILMDKVIFEGDRSKSLFTFCRGLRNKPDYLNYEKNIIINLFHQLLLIIILLDKEGFQHCDLHPDNIMVEKHDEKNAKKEIKLLNIPKKADGTFDVNQIRVLRTGDADYNTELQKMKYLSDEDSDDHYYSIKLIDFGEMVSSQKSIETESVQGSDGYCAKSRRELSEKILDLCLHYDARYWSSAKADPALSSKLLNLGKKQYKMDFVFFFSTVEVLKRCYDIFNDLDVDEELKRITKISSRGVGVGDIYKKFYEYIENYLRIELEKKLLAAAKGGSSKKQTKIKTAKKRKDKKQHIRRNKRTFKKNNNKRSNNNRRTNNNKRTNNNRRTNNKRTLKRKRNNRK